jgi:DNA modification methylase
MVQHYSQPRFLIEQSLPLELFVNELPKATFSDWTQDRIVPFWGTNAGAEVLPFQSWRHFKEAFAPELIARAINESNIKVNTCLDPFGGSGTTALACQFLGVHPIAIEVNPFLADLIESKLCSYNPNELADDLKSIISESHIRYNNNADSLQDLPPTFVEPGKKERWIFDDAIARRLASLRYCISKLTNKNHARLFKVILGGILIEASNVIVNGKGRRYRGDWNKRRRNANSVFSAFSYAARKAITEVHQFRNRSCLTYNMLRGDCREALKPEVRYDLVIFSPPYPNSFDYTDVYNVELWTLGYLRTKEANTALRESTLSSHVQVARAFPAAPTESATLIATIAQLDAVRAQLWNKSIPDMVGGYFAELAALLDNLYAGLTPGGKAWIVVGDSQYRSVQIETATIISEYAVSKNWTVESIEPFRSMRASPQQGGKAELAESLIVLSKAQEAV